MTGSALLLISQAQGVSWLLLAALPLGMGAGAVDSGLNGFVARHYSRRHMNWLHACWGIGATCGPLIMTQTIKVGYGWSGGFFVIASAQLTLAFVFLATLGLWDRQPEAVPSVLTETSDTSSVRRLHALQSPAAWLSFGVFALYVAVESSAGLWANSVLVLSRQVPQATAGLCVTAYYGSITVGRILVGFAPARWANRRLVLGGALLAVAGTSLLMLGKAPVFALPALVMMGLGFAPIFPGLMHEAPRRFVPEAVQSIIGRQGACAYSGAAFAPALAGWIAVRSTLESIPVFLFVGVLALAFCVWVLDRLCRA
jgi:fucose permease